MTIEELQDLGSALAQQTKEFVAKEIAAAVSPLVERIKELEARPALEYRGVWKEGTSYVAGDCVTDHGGMWIARRTPTRRPGDGDSGWQLAVARGRDARNR